MDQSQLNLKRRKLNVKLQEEGLPKVVGQYN